MNAMTKKLLVAAILLLAGLSASLGLAEGSAPVFSHAAHLEEGAECDTCHKSTEGNEFPTVQTKACEDCHDDGAPAYTPPGKAKRLPFKYPHKLHEDVGECAGCHKTIPSDQIATDRPWIDHAGCQACHEENGAEVNECQQCHGEGFKLPTKALPFEFPHPAHEDLDCGDCHKHGGEPLSADKPLLSQPDCQACHAENDVQVPEAKCSACHGVDQRKQAPADHAHAWLKKHGQESRWRVFADHGKDCSQCHRADGCRTCHKTRRPKNHTGLWRTRTHGVAAEWDRETCQTCHETGACIRCHRSTAPMNHNGAWRATHGLAAQSRSNEHCTVCHQASWCAACHRGH